MRRSWLGSCGFIVFSFLSLSIVVFSLLFSFAVSFFGLFEVGRKKQSFCTTFNANTAFSRLDFFFLTSEHWCEHTIQVSRLCSFLPYIPPKYLHPHPHSPHLHIKYIGTFPSILHNHVSYPQRLTPAPHSQYPSRRYPSFSRIQKGLSPRYIHPRINYP